MTKRISTGSMTEGALLAVITAILALTGTFIPFAGMITYLFVAVPIIILIIRNNFITGLLASFVAAFLVGLFTGPIAAIFFYIQFMAISLVYGFMMDKKYKTSKILFAGTTVSVVATILIILIGLFVTQITFDEQKQAVYDMIDSSIEFYKDTGMIKNFEKQGLNEDDIRQLLAQTIDLLFLALPTILIMAGLITAFTNFIMARITLKKLGLPSPAMPPFSEWRLPWYLIWGLIAGWGGYLLGDYFLIEILKTIGKNIMIAYAMVLFILGLSAIFYYLKKSQAGLVTRLGIAFFIVFLFNYTVLLVIAIGTFDLIFDYRRLNKSDQNK